MWSHATDLPSVCCSPYTDGNAVFNYIFMVIFLVDSCLSFRVAIIENDILITDSREIAKNYLRLVISALSSLLVSMLVPASCLDFAMLYTLH